MLVVGVMFCTSSLSELEFFELEGVDWYFGCYIQMKRWDS